MSTDIRARDLGETYSYLRIAMVGLLIGLAVSVFWQGFPLLGSVSAYYYTPAQAIFIGALIGLAACMIALKGTNVVEDVFLNIAGMFAALVAIVPTSRGEDHRAALNACREAAQQLSEKASPAPDCPSLEALEAATRANVVNNMAALVVVGVLGLIAAGAFAWRNRPPGKGFWWGFTTTVVVIAAGTATSWRATQWFIDHAHFIAAFGLLVCILVVAMANASRRAGTQPDGTQGRERTLNNGLAAARGALIRSPRKLNFYAWFAWVMLASAAVGVVLVVNDRLSLFWLEIFVTLLFVIFWTWQTFEQFPRPVVARGTSRASRRSHRAVVHRLGRRPRSLQQAPVPAAPPE